MKFATIMTKFKDGQLVSVDIIALVDAVASLALVKLKERRATHLPKSEVFNELLTTLLK